MPAGVGAAASALGLGAQLGTPAGLAALMRNASRLLGAGIPPVRNLRAFKGAIRTLVTLLGGLANTRQGGST